MDALTLGRLIRRLVLTSLSTPLVTGAVGCGTGTPDPATFSPPQCVSEGRLHVAGLMPAVPVDYVALREDSSITGTGPAVISESGTPCATARDMSTCRSKLAALPGQPGFHGCVDHACPHTLAMTQGDSVQAISDAAGVAGFLAPVDAPQEAVLIAYASGYDLSCSDRERGGVRPAPDGDGYEVLASRMTKDCAPIEITGYHLKVSKAGAVSVLSQRVLSTSSACVGRRPAGLVEPAPEACLAEDLATELAENPVAGCDAPGLVAVGEYFAAAARLEAASITAFEVLRAELLAHGAPAELLAAASEAAADEVRHAERTAALAARYGARCAEPRVEPRPPRPLLELAIENAVEGCVRETFGALLGAYQAAAAADPEVAAAMAGIAEDEARHAALAWRLAAWLEPQLDAGGLAAVRAARAEAVATLRRELAAPVPPELERLAGVPGPERALGLLTQLARELWV
ncbi:MAG: ferritin-like domain-containing protein [Polyangia bacterium]